MVLAPCQARPVTGHLGTGAWGRHYTPDPGTSTQKCYYYQSTQPWACGHRRSDRKAFPASTDITGVPLLPAVPSRDRLYLALPKPSTRLVQPQVHSARTHCPQHADVWVLHEYNKFGHTCGQKETVTSSPATTIADDTVDTVDRPGCVACAQQARHGHCVMKVCGRPLYPPQQLPRLQGLHTQQGGMM